jgi:hypothetical protein
MNHTEPEEHKDRRLCGIRFVPFVVRVCDGQSSARNSVVRRW